MIPLRSGEVAQMQQEQVRMLADVFVVGTLTERTDSDGGLTKAYSPSYTMIGSFYDPAGSSQFRNQITIAKCDAILRTQLGVTFGMGDLVHVVTRSGLPVSSEYYSVNGAPVTFRTTQIIPLSKIAPFDWDGNYLLLEDGTFFLFEDSYRLLLL